MAEPKKWRPSNGTMGAIFEADFCDNCRVRGICRILPKVYAFNVNDPEYPSQWIEEDDGPRCTSFVDKSAAPRRKYNCKNTMEMPL